MIDERGIPVVRRLWPTFSSVAPRYRIDPKLLLALAWVQSGLDTTAVSSAGAVGLMQMMPSTAADVAKRLGKPDYDLKDPRTSIDFAAAHLSSLITRFGLPRLGIAAYIAGPGAVQQAGGQVPDDRGVQRAVRNVMAVWHWLLVHLTDLLDDASSETSSSETADKALPAPSSRNSETPSTTSASTASTAVFVPPPWRLIAPPEDWKNPLPIDAAQVSVLEKLAARLNLAFTREDEQRKVYVGLPRAAVKPSASKGGLIIPVPGADARNNGAYASDTGIDIMVPVGSPVVAAGAGTIIYSEPGHTPWVTPPDTPNSILIALDTPFVYRGRKYGYTWYTHLSRLRYHVPDGSQTVLHVEQGQLIGWTGVGNRVPHLHFGVVGERSQRTYVPPFELAAYFGWMGR